MTPDLHHKVTVQHLKRSAYLYIRQSTLRQVTNNTESTRRQYDLRRRAVALGWGEEQIVVIDSDQGQSGSSADRIGFQKLVSEVGMGHAGMVMGLEVSRLARNCTDWHRLLEICALSDTLILDEDGLYNPSNFNDRLLLGLKGTMSEAELHMLRSRLHGGLINKAKRGELRIPLPIGFIYDPKFQVVLDPDSQVQGAIRALFTTFRRVGSAIGTVKSFRKEKILFPHRVAVRTPRSINPIAWKDLEISAILRILKNPRYAGVYCYGRIRRYKNSDGREISQKRSPEDWHAWIPDAHAGYISQQEYEENRRRLAENARAAGLDHRSPPREGPALLQGIVLCAKCGRRMRVRYHSRVNRQLVPSYFCPRKVESTCQAIHGRPLDQAIGELLVELMTPMTLEVSLSVQQELEKRAEQAEQLRRKQVDRARYEMDLARQRFLQVDPNNRLVAATLEVEWNEKLKLLAVAEQEFERWCVEGLKSLDAEKKLKILSLVSDFSRLWNDPDTAARERKRMVRLLIEDVTLHRKGQEVTVRIRFKAGATRTLILKIPPSAAQIYRTDSRIIQQIDRLLDHHSEREIAQRFNDKGLISSRGRSYTASHIIALRGTYKLKSRFHRLRDRGYLRAKEVASKLGIPRKVIYLWRRQGLLQTHYYGDRLYLYEDPTVGTNATPEEVRDRLQAASTKRPRQSNRNEVQYEA
ncbi:MAG: recombinase family protein [bacterium]|nr:recombinase family protein [bacterium]MCP4966522.1 recombinase family protein [bacterium]